jgi:hypothetical protein
MKIYKGPREQLMAAEEELKELKRVREEIERIS